MNFKVLGLRIGLTGLTLLLLFSYQNCSVEPIHESGELSSVSLTSGERIEIDSQLEAKALAIISSRCISCHNDFTAKFDVNVEGDSLELMNKGLIIAGLPEASLLYKSMIASNRQSDGVSPMPPNSPMASSETEVIRDWIENGIKVIRDNADGDGQTISYNYQDHIQPILQKNMCLSCHSEDSGSSASMGAYILLDSYDRLMNFVQVGNPYSLLLESIRQGNMPKDAEAMSEDDFKVLENWVSQGALETKE